VEGLTRVDVANRAGVEPTFVDRVAELGIVPLDPDGAFSPRAARHVRILRSLDEAGLPLRAVAEAIHRNDLTLNFVDEPAYERFSGLTDTTFADLARETGIPPEVLLAMREATGFAQPSLDDRVRENEIEVVPYIKAQIDYGIRPAVVERALRATGESLRRIAEVEADWWATDVLGPVLASGGTADDLHRQTGPFAETIGPLGDQALLALLHGHQSNAWMKNIFEGFEFALARAGLHNPTERPPAICFLDLSGYTRLTEERGDAAAADLASRLARLVQRTSAPHGGKPIKWLGDGVMFHFRDPGPGVLAALEMVEEAAKAALPPAHVGLHAGPVLFQEGDYYGRTVNVAARIADYARQGEVLVSSEVVAATGTRGVTFEAIGPVELKGLTEAVELHVARRAASPA
jgi:adenylate cyclase